MFLFGKKHTGREHLLEPEEETQGEGKQGGGPAEILRRGGNEGKEKPRLDRRRAISILRSEEVPI